MSKAPCINLLTHLVTILNCHLLCKLVCNPQRYRQSLIWLLSRTSNTLICTVTSWRGFNVFETDFGFGTPVQFLQVCCRKGLLMLYSHRKYSNVSHYRQPPQLPLVAVIRPQPPSKGGEQAAQVQLTFPSADMMLVKQDPCFLQFAHYFENGKRYGHSSQWAES